MPACLMCSSEFEPKRKSTKPLCCYVCHPFEKGRQSGPFTAESSIPELLMCLKCLTPTPKTGFYRYPNNVPHQWCKICSAAKTRVSQHQFKIDCLLYKGTLCVDCGKMPHPAAMEFHHLDPKGKDFTVSDAKTKVLSDIVKMELDKCVVLCRNCHAVRHAQTYWSEKEIQNLYAIQ